MAEDDILRADRMAASLWNNNKVSPPSPKLDGS
jgi:hypothetical protein